MLKLRIKIGMLKHKIIHEITSWWRYRKLIVETIRAQRRDRDKNNS